MFLNGEFHSRLLSRATVPFDIDFSICVGRRWHKTLGSNARQTLDGIGFYVSFVRVRPHMILEVDGLVVVVYLDLPF